MLLLTKTLLFIALIHYHARVSSLHVRTYSKNWTLPENSTKSLVQGTLFTADAHNFPYATCEFTKPNVEKTCNVTLVTTTRREYTCAGVKVFAGDNDRELFLRGYFQLIPFSVNYVAVVWWDQTKASLNASEKKQNFHISMLSMVSCKIGHVDFPIDKVAFGFFPTLIPYANQVDVILNSKKSCEGADKCRLSFALEGEQFGGVKPYLPKVSGYASPVSTTWPARGFFQYVKDLSSISVLFVNSAGEGKEVMNVKFEKQRIAKRDAFSNTHGLYSICWTPSISTKNPTTISCSQFDDTGKQFLRAVITYPQLLNWVAVRNLPRIGILLATGGCENPGSTDEDCKNFRVYRIDASGMQLKPYVIEAPAHECYDITSDLEVRISEDYNRDEFCFDFSCLPWPKNLKFTSKCVPKREFLK